MKWAKFARQEKWSLFPFLGILMLGIIYPSLLASTARLLNDIAYCARFRSEFLFAVGDGWVQPYGPLGWTFEIILYLLVSFLLSWPGNFQKADLNPFRFTTLRTRLFFLLVLIFLEPPVLIQLVWF